jgi:monomeric isocitrate dehydrogenase
MFSLKSYFLCITNNEIVQNSKSKPKQFSFLCTFKELGTRTGNGKATTLGDSLMEAVGLWLEYNRGPGRKAREIDNRLTQ